MKDLSTSQCSTGITQSRPYPARAGKIMESAAQTCESVARDGHEIDSEGEGARASSAATNIPHPI